MCEYCDNKNKESHLATYCNGDSMNVKFGTKQGVQIWAYLTMKGNMLLVDATGNYRSTFDCYYESWDLDGCDGENAHMSTPAYVGIKYCPFCGKKLESNLYEILSTKDKIIEDKKRLNYNKKLKYMNDIYVNFTRSRLSPLESNEYKNNPQTIEDLLNKGVNIKASVFYGSYDQYYFGEPENLDDFSIGTKISRFYECGNKSVSDMYKVDIDTLRELEKLGLAKVIKKKVADIVRSKEEYLKRVEMLSKEIEELERKLKEYE